MENDSNSQLPVVLEQETNKNNESNFNTLSKTLKEMEELINKLPSTPENESIISSLKEKIELCLTELSERQNSLENSNQNIINTNNKQSMDNKMDLLLNKMDIMLNLIMILKFLYL